MPGGWRHPRFSFGFGTGCCPSRTSMPLSPSRARRRRAVSRPDVALISPYPVSARHDGRSGVASYSANLATALAAGGATVTVVAQDEDGAPRNSSDGEVAIQRAFRLGATALPRAARAALSTKAPVVHLQHEFFLYGGPASVPGLPLALSAIRA